jgi:hypothetical protein
VSSTLTYVYCLVRSAKRPSLRGVPVGMPGGREVRVLDVGEGFPKPPRHWLIVSTVPERAYGEAALERGLQHLEWVGPRALAHEAVVEHFLSAAAVLPMQLFTLFKEDARAVEHVVLDERRIARILKRIERQVEWGLRLAWDPPDAPDAVPRTGSRSGVDYLARKRDLRDFARKRLKDAQGEADRLYRAVSREASAARRRTATEQAAPGSRLLLDAAFLVPARRAGAFRASVRRGARSLEGSGIVVSLTGPWPPYNFI